MLARRGFLAAVTVALVIPGGAILLFDGLPFSTLPEFAAFAVIAPFFFSRSLRAGLGTNRFLLGVAVCVAVAKVGLLAPAFDDGFAACYRSTLVRPGSWACESSYENPLRLRGATRIDKTIDFSGSRWNLVFFNTTRFNFYPWQEGNVLRDRLPFSGRWTGRIDAAADQTVSIEYTGEVSATVAARRLQFPPSYEGLRVETLAVPRGTTHVRIDYRFDDGYRTGEGPMPGPYATLRLSRHGALLTTPSVAPRAASAAVDLVFVVLLAPFGQVLWTQMAQRRRRLLIAVACGAPALVILRDVPRVPKGLHLALMLAITVGSLTSREPLTPVARYLTVLWLAFFRAAIETPATDTVVLRTAGDDWLTYQSFAYDILDGRSLEAGEAIFYHMPLFRYVAFVQHAVLGDGDMLVAASGLAALQVTLLWAFVRVSAGTRRRALVVTAGCATLALSSSQHVVSMILVGVSEYPTWIFVPLAFAVLITARTSMEPIAGGIFAGLAFTARPNQGAGLGVLLVVFLLTSQRSRATKAGAVLAALAVASSVAVHNLWYGRQIVPLLDPSNPSAALLLNPVFVLVWAPWEWQVFWHQLGLTFGLRGMPRLQFSPPIVRGLSVPAMFSALYVLLASWIAAAALVVRARPLRQSARPLFVLAVPAVFLIVQLFLDAEPYYPRHIIVGYFAIGIAVALSASDALPHRKSGNRLPP